MGLFRRKTDNEYLKRQAYIMSNLGLFYIIIIALFGVPLLGTFVVVLIKGVIDLRVVIVPVVTLALILFLFLGVRGLWRLMRRIRKDGRQAMDAARKQNQEGQPVQISVFNGLFALTFGNTQSQPAIPYDSSSKSLPAPSQEKHGAEGDVILRLKELVALRKAGEIDDREFELLKAQIIKNTCGIDSDQQEP